MQIYFADEKELAKEAVKFIVDSGPQVPVPRLSSSLAKSHDKPMNRHERRAAAAKLRQQQKALKSLLRRG